MYLDLYYYFYFIFLKFDINKKIYNDYNLWNFTKDIYKFDFIEGFENFYNK